MIRFAPFEDAQTGSLVALWEACGLTRPWNPPEADIAAFAAHPAAEILTATEGADVVASVAVGYDGHRGWAYYVATRPDRRGKGLGRAAMAAAEGWLRRRGAVKIQLMVRDGNTPVLSFYAGQGYADSGVRVLQKWLDPERDRLYREGADAG